jgi:hypothetical protein
MSETYEELRDSADGAGGDAWKAADREESNLRSLYRELKEDPRYTDEHKAEQAWKQYERTKDKIAAGKEKAKDLLQKQALSGERFSIPMPAEEALTTSDTQKLLASQNEATRIVRKIDRQDTGAKGPFKPDRTETLKQEYGRGLEVGGVQGGAICRGVLSVCDELGMDKHGVVDGFRKERHHESLERGAHSERLLDLIGGSAPEPPFPRPGERPGRGSNDPRRSSTLLLPKEAPLALKPTLGSPGKRRPWK